MYFCFVYFEIIILTFKYTVKLCDCFFFYHTCVLKLFLWYWIFDLTTTSNYSVSKWYPIIAFLGPCCFQSVQKNGPGSRRRRVRKRHLGTSNGKRRVRKFFFLIFFLKSGLCKDDFQRPTWTSNLRQEVKRVDFKQDSLSTKTFLFNPLLLPHNYAFWRTVLISIEFREFMKLALDFLSHCYHIDVDFTQQLLTDDLINFSNTTCVTLAVDVMHYDFVAHNCCQNLINDIWMGGLQTRKNSSIKVSFLFIELCLIVFYIFILCLSDTVNVKMFNCRKFRKYLFIITSILTKDSC